MANIDPAQLMTRAERLHARREQLGRPRDVDVGRLFQKRMTAGQRAADGFANVVGSWRFIIIQSIVLVAWITVNASGVLGPWDPYPFILLNLALSFQAAYAAPIIMMSQNRAGQLDRLSAKADYQVNQKAEAEVEEILTLLRAQVALLERLQDQLRGPSTDGRHGRPTGG
jgi:uncharacterized membrane protein